VSTDGELLGLSKLLGFGPSDVRIPAKFTAKVLLEPLFRQFHGEVRAEGRAGKAGTWSDRGNCTGGYSSSTNSSKGTPYAQAIFVTVGM
jgi:hypothetical protein